MIRLILEAVKEWVLEIVAKINNTLVQLDIVENLDSYTGVSVKDFGAIGDGVTDDSQAFLNAIAENTTIKIPRGSYNLNHVAMTIPNHITIVGEGAKLTELLNSKIEAHNGITIKDITFNGGSKRWINNPNYGGGFNSALNGKNMIIECTPTSDNVNIEYYRCVFKNADIGSVAFHGTGATETDYPIVKNVVKDCVFDNIAHCGVFHWLNITEGAYTGNTFKNIGNSDGVTGDRLVGLALGDVSNFTDHDIDRCIIEGNVFDTLISLYDTASVKHTVSANFITVQGERVDIINNSFKNLLGYGNDREGIYTKGHFVEIANNTLENCGTGEGYICAKFRKESIYNDRIINIHDNNIFGKIGRGIAVYGTSRITNNSIRIENAKGGISCFGENDIATGTCDIYHNQFVCGTGTLIIDGETVNNYSITNFIEANKYPYGVKIKDNSITVERKDEANISVVIKTTDTISDVDISGNTINAVATMGILVATSSSATPKRGKTELTININDNIISEMKNNGININIVGLSIRAIAYVKNNIIKGIVNSSEYAISVWDSDDNSDVLYFDTQQSATLYAKGKHVATNISKVVTNVAADVDGTNTVIEDIDTNPDIDLSESGDLIIKGTDGTVRKIVFNQDGTCSWATLS